MDQDLKDTVGELMDILCELQPENPLKFCSD
jgi:hypothetical protein